MTTKQTVSERIELLVDGCMKQQFKTSKEIEMSGLICIIVSFVGNLLIRFDAFHPKFKDEVIDNGKKIQRMHGSPAVFGCTIGFQSGIHEVRVKCIRPGFERIGIVSELSQCESEKGWIEESKDSYYYYNYMGIYGNNVIKVPTNIAWEKGDIIKVIINCDNWNISFYYNKECLAKETTITPDKCYYFVIAAHPSKACSYQILD